MNKCLYHGKVIYSFDVAKDFQMEKIIRESSNELFCCDPDCAGAVRYKHGTVRAPYFAHIAADRQCDYDKYINGSSEIFRKICSALYDHFKKFSEYEVEMDVKLLRDPSHYTPVTVCGKDFKFAIDITDKRTASNTLSERKARYAEVGYESIQIIVDEIRLGNIDGRFDLRYQTRYELNTSLNNLAVIAAEDGLTYAVYKMDTEDYSDLYSVNDLSRYNIFNLLFDLSALRVNANGLQIEGLDEKYNEWLRKRREIKRSFTEKDKEKSIVAPKEKTVRSESFITTGKFIGDRINGKTEELDLHDITINKNSQNYHGVYDIDTMQEKVKKAFSGRASDVRLLMDKMYHANDDEKEMFIGIFEEYLNYPESEENSARIKILTYIIEQAEVFE